MSASVVTECCLEQTRSFVAEFRPLMLTEVVEVLGGQSQNIFWDPVSFLAGESQWESTESISL